MTSAIRVVDDSSITKRLLDFVEANIIDGKSFDPERLNEHNWIALPREGFSHLSDDEIAHLTAALASLEVDNCFAVALEKLKHHPPVFEVEISIKGLNAFNWECGPFSYCLTTLDHRFCILCSHLDYQIFAGSVEDVELLIGTSMDEARKEFARYISIDEWQVVERNLLTRIYKECSASD